MSPFTTIGNFKYWTDLLVPEETAAHFEKQSEELRKAKNANPRAGYGAWMSSRRHGEYLNFAKQQAKQVHGTAIVVNGNPVCNCALVAEIEVTEEPIPHNVLLLTPGHLSQEGKSVVTAFYIYDWDVAMGVWALHLYCQICYQAEPADETSDEKIDLMLLEDFRAKHKHNEECK